MWRVGLRGDMPAMSVLCSGAHAGACRRVQVRACAHVYRVARQLSVQHHGYDQSSEDYIRNPGLELRVEKLFC